MTKAMDEPERRDGYDRMYAVLELIEYQLKVGDSPLQVLMAIKDMVDDALRKERELVA